MREKRTSKDNSVAYGVINAFRQLVGVRATNKNMNAKTKLNVINAFRQLVGVREEI